MDAQAILRTNEDASAWSWHAHITSARITSAYHVRAVQPLCQISRSKCNPIDGHLNTPAVVWFKRPSGADELPYNINSLSRLIDMAHFRLTFASAVDG